MEILDEKLQALSLQLKKEVSAFDVESFVGFFCYFIRYKSGGEVISQFQSRLKDFLYLMALNVTAQNRGTEDFWMKEQELKSWAKDLRSIKDCYRDIGLGELGDNEDVLKKVIHNVSFHTYFENGVLNYVEQDLDRLKRIFTPYDEVIEKDFGFNTQFLIRLYRFSEFVGAEKYKRQREFQQDPAFGQFLSGEKHHDLAGRLAALPPDVKRGLDNFMISSHDSFKFTREEYCSAFAEEKIDRFLEIFVLDPKPNDRFLFFAQGNPLDEKPIIKLPSGEYLFAYQKQLPLAMSNFLYKHLQLDPKRGDKIRKHRDRTLEIKTEDIFKTFFKNDSQAFYHTGYHVETNTEQDILILSRNLALIIEIKASKFKEPFRDSIKGYSRIKDDFDSSIQYGYQQCLRVENKFYENEPFYLYKKEQPYQLVDPAKYTKVFSIVVTLERFGPIQTDLKLMLQKQEDFHFPWSVYIDDLETFLLALRKCYSHPVTQLIDFLLIREQLHGRLYASDELDICGAFLSNKTKFMEFGKMEDSMATFHSGNQQIFDELYFAGLGFEDELFIEKKKN
ncbi:hypothetical protein [Pedobacter sp. KBW06]|uniref:hypothetical protein n=1 Tax=Pedobacter sp. KBW06 TaxID=2153359 RepID=UPI000F59E953|nr:hypothetical protein [Pedobacter sp. KBW06]